ncbi:hypothetical protein GCM10009601_56670 [Streptomyces thermospinosisporus]|uniref:Uncharacterized protein n=1 Tax=Streptomyces thermospinosisporus TaxID=161482 RepID=A0ABP4JXD2_9ACTN
MGMKDQFQEKAEQLKEQAKQRTQQGQQRQPGREQQPGRRRDEDMEPQRREQEERFDRDYEV